tara:strand:- start:364 stop:567 length:204 start_codon:yes stop_codon:yes gene_type:complete
MVEQRYVKKVTTTKAADKPFNDAYLNKSSTVDKASVSYFEQKTPNPHYDINFFRPNFSIEDAADHQS